MTNATQPTGIPGIDNAGKLHGKGFFLSAAQRSMLVTFVGLRIAEAGTQFSNALTEVRLGESMKNENELPMFANILFSVDRDRPSRSGMARGARDLRLEHDHVRRVRRARKQRNEGAMKRWIFHGVLTAVAVVIACFCVKRVDNRQRQIEEAPYHAKADRLDDYCGLTRTLLKVVQREIDLRPDLQQSAEATFRSLSYDEFRQLQPCSVTPLNGVLSNCSGSDHACIRTNATTALEYVEAPRD